MVFSVGSCMSWSLLRIPLEANAFLPLVNPLSAFLSMFSTLCCVCQSFPIYGLPFLLCLAMGSSMTAQSLHQGILGVGLFTCQRLTWTPAGLGVTGWDGYLSLELCPAAGPWALCHFPMPQIPRPLRKPPHSGDSWFLEFLGFILKSIGFQSHEKAERHMEIFYLSFFVLHMRFSWALSFLEKHALKLMLDGMNRSV